MSLFKRKEKVKPVELVDLLNDLQREEQIKKRIKEHLDKNLDAPPRYNYSSNPFYNPSLSGQIMTASFTSMTFVDLHHEQQFRAARLSQLQQEERQRQGHDLVNWLNGDER